MPARRVHEAGFPVTILFWLLTFLAIYPYVIYPLALWLLAKVFPTASQSRSGDGSVPSITVVVSAHNEEAVIEEKIRTSLACIYPRDRLSILVVSDASTDATNDIVGRLAADNDQVELLAISEHRGKTAGLNLAMETIASDVVVFTDANAIFDPSALEKLVERLNDPAIGYVVGAQKYASSEHAAGENEGLYWRYELALKGMESRFDSVVGGDGAIYAVRRALFQPLAPEDINDFVNPLQVIAQGKRGVFCEDAVAYEDPAEDFGKEFRRKRRIVCRSWGALLRYFGRLNLHRNPRFAFMLVSHKVIRWFTLLWIVMALAANVFVIASGASLIYVFTLIAGLSSVLLALVGWLSASSGTSMPAPVSFAYYFYLANLAALLGIIDYALGNRYVTWQHVRST